MLRFKEITCATAMICALASASARGIHDDNNFKCFAATDPLVTIFASGFMNDGRKLISDGDWLGTMVRLNGVYLDFLVDVRKIPGEVVYQENDRVKVRYSDELRAMLSMADGNESLFIRNYSEKLKRMGCNGQPK